MIDWGKLGYTVEVSLRMTLDKTDPRAFDEFLAAAREVPLGGGARLADLLPALGADHPGLQITAGGAERPLPLSPDALGPMLQSLLSAGTRRLEAE